MLKCLVSVAIACFMVSSPVVQVHDESAPVLTTPLMANYNDNDYEIVLSADELNNYTWLNLYNYVDSLNNDTIPISIGSVSYDSYSNITLNAFDNYLGADITLQDTIILNNQQDYKFHWSNGSQYDSFSYSLTITSNNTYYTGIKQAIEADVLANSPSETMPSISDIFSEVTSVISNFIGSLGQAFNSVTALFWDSTAGAFTFLGVLILIGVGAGLVYLAYRVISGLMHRV